ncbi:hypothetical protein N7534_006474 [Penicillium rubens]|nr:hypothetical protein N7534_006474 [Penicillium rubens]
MATRTIYLISARNTSFQRAHFSIFVPSATNPDRGTKIHAVGAPMAGYVLEFKRNYNPSLEPHDQTFPIGQVHSSDVVDSPDAAPSIDSTPPREDRTSGDTSSDSGDQPELHGTCQRCG